MKWVLKKKLMILLEILETKTVGKEEVAVAEHLEPREVEEKAKLNLIFKKKKPQLKLLILS